MRWFTLARTAHRYWRMAHDPRTPAIVRYLVYGGIVFTILPEEWLPEWVPGVGLLEDAVVVPGIIGLSLALIPKEVKEDAAAASPKNLDRSAGIASPAAA